MKIKVIILSGALVLMSLLAAADEQGQPAGWSNSDNHGEAQQPRRNEAPRSMRQGDTNANDRPRRRGRAKHGTWGAMRPKPSVSPC